MFGDIHFIPDFECKIKDYFLSSQMFASFFTEKFSPAKVSLQNLQPLSLTKPGIHATVGH